MKPGRPWSHVFSHGQVSRLPSFSSLSEIVCCCCCWLKFTLRQFLPEFLCFSDSHLGRYKPQNTLPFSGSLQNWMLWPCWKERLIFGEHGEMGGHSALRAWQKQNRMSSFFLQKLTRKVKQTRSHVGEKLDYCFHFMHSKWGAARSSNMAKVTQQICGRAAQAESISSEGWSKVYTKKIFSSHVLCPLGSSPGWVRKCSPMTYFLCQKISPALCLLQLLFNKLSV